MRPDQLVVLEHRNGDGGAGAAEPGRRAGVGFRRIVDGVSHLLGVEDAAEQALVRRRSIWPALLLEFDQCRRGADAGGAVDAIAVAAKQRAVARLADAHRVLQHSVGTKMF